MTDPTAEDALRVASAATGAEAVSASRFTTGLHHFVYEVTLADGGVVVLRMTRPSERQVMRNAVALSRQLRPLGVPLPELLGMDLDASHPWMMLERLPGTDLQQRVGLLSEANLQGIAEGVAAAQAVVARTPTAGSFGYAPSPAEAPFARWSEVVASHVKRSRGRIESAGLFDSALVIRVERAMDARRAELDAIPATPFLHDTTTKNVIVSTEGEFSGIVDVDDLCFGDPRYVAALTEVALRAHGLSAAYAHQLMDAAGWVADDLYRLYVAAFLLDFMSEHGQRFNDNQTASTPEARANLLALFQEALRSLD